MLEKIQVILQYLLPKKWLTYLIGLGSAWKGGWITHYVISLFVRFYNISLQECYKKNLKDYTTFNDFFTRKLNFNIRFIDKNPHNLIIPADGIISQIGKITDTHIFQVKHSSYYLDELLAGHDNIINIFKNGSFIVIYIPPYDCHRVYMPCTGRLSEMLYIPGELFSVHPKIVKNIPHVLSRNERIICIFDTDFGYIAQILVGATIVGSIETTWLGTVTPPRTGIVKHWHYPINKNENGNNNIIKNNTILLNKGKEMGLFKLGSTVINLFNKEKILLNDQLKPNDMARIGQTLARGIISSPTHNNNNK